MEVHYIYTITNPLTNLVFYVGRTVNPRTRFSQHMSVKTNEVGKVIQSILKEDLKPIFTIVEESDNRNCSNVEHDLVIYYHKLGHPIVNHVVNQKHRELNYDIVFTDKTTYKIEDLTLIKRC